MEKNGEDYLDKKNHKHKSSLLMRVGKTTIDNSEKKELGGACNERQCPNVRGD